MEIDYTNKAKKELVKIPKRELKKIFAKIEALASEPDSGKPLKGEFKGLFSFRAWPYRIIYEVSKKSITIHHIAHSQGVYK